MMRIVRGAAAALLLALTLTATACTGDGDGSGEGGGVVGKARAERKLIVGVRADQPGIGLRTGDTYTGLDIEMAKIVAKGLGVPESGIDYKITVASNREPFIQQGQVDIVVAAYPITGERRKVVNFAGPYYVGGQDLLVRQGSKITGPESLDGKKVCALSASTPAKRILADYQSTILQQANSYAKCVASLLDGSVDAVTADDLILTGYAAQDQNLGRLALVGKKFSEESYGIGIAKDDVEGCNRINEILKTAASDGSYKTAWDRTLGKSGVPAPALDTTKFVNCG